MLRKIYEIIQAVSETALAQKLLEKDEDMMLTLLDVRNNDYVPIKKLAKFLIKCLEATGNASNNVRTLMLTLEYRPYCGLHAISEFKEIEAFKQLDLHKAFSGFLDYDMDVKCDTPMLKWEYSSYTWDLRNWSHHTSVTDKYLLSDKSLAFANVIQAIESNDYDRVDYFTDDTLDEMLKELWLNNNQ